LDRTLAPASFRTERQQWTRRGNSRESGDIAFRHFGTDEVLDRKRLVPRAMTAPASAFLRRSADLVEPNSLLCAHGQDGNHGSPQPPGELGHRQRPAGTVKLAPAPPNTDGKSGVPIAVAAHAGSAGRVTHELLPSERSALDGVSGPLGPGQFLPKGRTRTPMDNVHGVQRFQPSTSIFRSEGDSFQIRHVQRCDTRQEARFTPRQASTLAGALRAKVG